MASAAATAIAAAPSAAPAPVSRPSTSPSVARAPLWRLKVGAPPELQRVIDDQDNIRQHEWKRLMRARNSAQAFINRIAKVARHDHNQRQLAKEIGDKQRERFKAFSVLVKENEERRVAAYPHLHDFDLMPDFVRNAMPAPPGPQASRPQRTYRLGPGGVRVGHYPFTGATVVSIVDEHTAVLRPRAVTLVDYQLNDVDTFYVWYQEVTAIREREPVLAIHLPSTKEWKPGDVVSIGEYWIRRGLPDNADGTPPVPEISMTAFDPTLIERSESPAGSEGR